MGCLRLTYEEDESPLRVSREPESDTENWQVWVNETPAKKVKEVGDQPSGGVDQTQNGWSVRAGFGIPDNEFGYDNGNLARELIGGGLVGAGQPIIKKPFVTPGSSTGTSPASKLLNKIIKVESPVRLPTVVWNKAVKGIRYTKSFGKFAGRTVPYIGWGLLAWDVVDLSVKAYNWFVNGKEGVLDDITFSTSKPGFPSVK
ncbi:MAG: hypothetical protein AAF620_20570, partial [Bacteroidota bacterium]